MKQARFSLSSILLAFIAVSATSLALISVSGGLTSTRIVARLEDQAAQFRASGQAYLLKLAVTQADLTLGRYLSSADETHKTKLAGDLSNVSGIVTQLNTNETERPCRPLPASRA